jgi:hypothetical protein
VRGEEEVFEEEEDIGGNVRLPEDGVSRARVSTRCQSESTSGAVWCKANAEIFDKSQVRSRAAIDTSMLTQAWKTARKAAFSRARARRFAWRDSGNRYWMVAFALSDETQSW